MLNILFSSNDQDWQDYETALREAFSSLSFETSLSCGEHDPETIDVIIFSPNSDIRDFTPYARLKAVLSLWAGVDSMLSIVPPEIPLARMVSHCLTQGMVEYVVGHVLRHHLGMDVHIQRQDQKWQPELLPPLSDERSVGILGLGALGSACATALAELGFKVSGWSRSQKQVQRLECVTGVRGLREVLGKSEILVLLLPSTPDTADILNGKTLAMLPKGAVVINPARGSMIDEEALIAALETGHLSHATLDVFKTEPLPEDHPFWRHPKITVTPHIAAATRPSTAAKSLVENVQRVERGEPLLHVVERERGY